MSGFKKPSVIAREAKVKIYDALGKNVPADTRRGFTDTFELLSPTVRIGYKKRARGTTYPTQQMKTAALAASRLAQKIIRKANDEFAGIIMLRRKESQLFQDVMDKHFGLIAGDDAGMLSDNIVNKKFSLSSVNKKDRRWVLERLRRNMLHLSFHLNTGIYLIDSDAANRNLRSGQTFDPTTADAGEEAYVSAAKTEFDKNTWRATDYSWVDNKLTCGYRHGEIHVSLDVLKDYSTISYARVIIHEATHKYLNTDDEAYAHEGTYGTLSLDKTMNNADSYAWAAVSLYCGAVRMGDTGDYNPDWANAAKV